ncbi:hypothetical protein ACJMK2_016438 [Sinanodonta woodiana]|uniref:Caveolin n=1 Tax=Sinanodonta woodiana TaxID=1069815 RepID=A0ABD3UWN9_SINWO
MSAPENDPNFLIERDPNDLNIHVKVNFEDSLGEPDGARSFDCLWTNSYNCFNCGKNCCYKFLTSLCGMCIALCWGCDFALTTFTHVWCLTPLLRDCSITAGFLQKFCGTIINVCLTPVCEACGMCFSKIQITKR